MAAQVFAPPPRAAGVVVGAALCLVVTGAVATTIVLDSVPKGAQVCVKERGALQCLGTTPLKLDTELATQQESKRYFFKKIGYQTETALASSAKPSVRVSLKRRDIFFDPQQQVNPELQRLQRNVNAVLGKLIYESTSTIGGLDVEIVGKVRVQPTGDRAVLRVGMLVTNAKRRHEIGSVRRQHESAERNARLARAVLRDEGAEMLRLLTQALQPVKGVDEITLSIDYVKAGAVLADESVHFLRTYVTAQYERQTGSGTRERVTEYTTVRHREEVTKVEDELQIRTLLVSAPIDKLAHLGSRWRDVDAVLRTCSVFTNDNRRKEFKDVVVN